MKEDHEACVLLYTKPARPGRVKTQLIGELSSEQASVVKQLATLLDERTRRDRSLGASPERVEMDAARLERLRALGYIDSP